ncbi:hypothetical protein [Pseudoteredinibacter isoporae]|uniref:hypothetical protein n=1 Tax=Pseudoteredinibacter isoporae TaxID=570281 RepID=UPI003341E595
MWNLDWKDVFLKKRYARLHETKNVTRRDVPLSSEAIRLLKLLRRNKSVKVLNTS